VEVASFLLNEKRNEIAKIELKQRINVLMVPNKSLETPNYKLERLKHDDPRLDNITASYTLAEEVEDVTAVTRRSQEPTNRQTPVIKGVLPDVPAPVAPPKPEPVATGPVATPVTVSATVASSSAATPAAGGFFGWLKNLFGGTTAPMTPAKAPAPDATAAMQPAREGRGTRDGNRSARGDRPDGRGPRGEGRSGRGGRGGERGGRDRTERPPRDRQDTPAQALSADASATNNNFNTPVGEPGREPRGERSGRGGRGERRARGPRPDVQARSENPQDAPLCDANLPEQAAATRGDNATPPDNAPTRDDAGGREKRSRDRYGRERRPRGERANAVTVPDAAPEQLAVMPDTATTEAPEATPRKSYFDTSAQNTAVQPTAGAVAPVASESVESASKVESNPATAPESVVEAAAPVKQPDAVAVPTPAVIPAYTLPVTELEQVAQQSGLTWVRSDADKVAAIQAQIAAQPQPVHVPRERPAVVQLDDRPLVLVETKRDLRATTLAFEEQKLL